MQPWCLGTACLRLRPPQLSPVQAMWRFSVGYLEHRTLTIFAFRWQMGLVGFADFIIGGRFRDHFHCTKQSTKQAQISDTGANVALWAVEMRIEGVKVWRKSFQPWWYSNRATPSTQNKFIVHCSHYTRFIRVNFYLLSHAFSALSNLIGFSLENDRGFENPQVLVKGMGG